jgi:hypothetical protein
MIKDIIKSTTSREHRPFYATVFSICVVLLVVAQRAATGDTARKIDVQIFHPLVFKSREFLNPPRLDPRIKILAYDDTTVAHEGAVDISLKDWSKTLRHIMSHSDVTVGIDKLFDYPAEDQNPKDFRPHFESPNGSILGHIVFADTKKIKGRSEISDELVLNSLKRTFVTPPENIPGYNESLTLYGAAEGLRDEFDFFGPANYKGDNHVRVIWNTGTTMVPHLGIAMGRNLKLDASGLWSGSSRIHHDSDGEILVNFAKPDTYRKAAYSFLPVLERARRNFPNKLVDPGDFVLILPAMYTGHTDYVQSPFGPIPGGFHLAALLNSALTGSWLREITDPGFFVIATAAIGFGVGIGFSGATAIVGMVLSILLIPVASILLFAFAATAISFPMPILGLLIGGLGGILIRSHVSQIESFRKSQELAVAAMVQKTFFPGEEASKSGGCEIFGHFEPASECGGDWWGTFQVLNKTYVILGDATGHGVPAALITSLSYAISKSIHLELERTGQLLHPSQILEEFNTVLCSLKSDYAQMTLTVFKIDEVSGKVTFANAANQPPFLIKGENENARVSVLNAVGNLVGELTDQSYDEHEIELKPGDKIIVFTDGIFENRRADEKAQLGKSWLKATLHKHKELPGRDLFSRVWSDYRAAIGTTPPDDDATLVVIERQKTQS